jgi:hypothetical protein
MMMNASMAPQIWLLVLLVLFASLTQNVSNLRSRRDSL